MVDAACIEAEAYVKVGALLFLSRMHLEREQSDLAGCFFAVCEGGGGGGRGGGFFCLGWWGGGGGGGVILWLNTIQCV